jgi:hypothetical protein
MRRLVIAAVLVIASGFASRSQAFAADPGPTATGSADPSGALVSAGSGTGTAVSESTGPQGGTAVSGGPCPAGQSVTYKGWMEGGVPLVAQPGDVSPVDGQPVVVGSSIVDVFCGGVFVQTVIVPPGGAAGGGAVVSPLQLAQQALASARFAPLVSVMSPPSGR